MSNDNPFSNSVFSGSKVIGKNLSVISSVNHCIINFRPCISNGNLVCN